MTRYLAGLVTGLVLAGGLAWAQARPQAPVPPLPTVSTNLRVLAKCDGMDELLKRVRSAESAAVHTYMRILARSQPPTDHP